MSSQFSYGVSKTFEAPMEFVFAWCTDFSDDDPKIIGAAYTRHVLEKTEQRAVWIHHYKREGVEKDGVRIVTFSPPDSWHLEGINEERDMTGEYHLSALGGGRTKLDLTITTRYKGVKPDSREELQRNLSNDWDKFKAALERDYSSSA